MMVLGTLGVAMLVLVNFVLPNFAQLFSMFGNNLPLPTRMLLAFSHFAGKYNWLMLVMLVLSIIGIRYYIKTEKGAYQGDKQFLRIPIFGALFLKIQIARASRVLAMLNQSGIPILEALNITAQTIQNQIISDSFLKVREKVRAGEGLAKPIRNGKIFPPIMANMVAVGEKSGNLSEMLYKVAEYFEEEIENTLDNLSSLIEPILIAVLACGVLFMALAVFMPMWNMMNVMK
jgi:MSHA biogenesis protein MshG